MTLAYNTSDGTIMEALNNKADIDLNNLSADDKLSLIEEHKETIIGWMIPDYSRGVDIVSSITTGYTVPKMGVIVIYSLPATGSSQIILNDVTILNKVSTTGDYAVSLTLPVNQGDIIKMQTYTNASITFFPFKGAI